MTFRHYVLPGWLASFEHGFERVDVQDVNPIHGRTNQIVSNKQTFITTLNAKPQRLSAVYLHYTVAMWLPSQVDTAPDGKSTRIAEQKMEFHTKCAAIVIVPLGSSAVGVALARNNSTTPSTGTTRR